MQFYTKVVGVTFEEREKKIQKLYRAGKLEPDTELLLEREPSNEYDKNAIGVYTKNKVKLGFLSKELAVTVAENMKNGVMYRAFVTEVTGNYTRNHYGINIRVEYR